MKDNHSHFLLFIENLSEKLFEKREKGSIVEFSAYGDKLCRQSAEDRNTGAMGDERKERKGTLLINQ